MMENVNFNEAREKIIYFHGNQVTISKLDCKEGLLNDDTYTHNARGSSRFNPYFLFRFRTWHNPHAYNGHFFPVAIVQTGIVHFLNGSFKVFLLKKHIHFPTLWRFGFLAIPSAFLGVWMLTRLEGQTEVLILSLFEKEFSTTPIKLTVGLLMIGPRGGNNR